MTVFRRLFRLPERRQDPAEDLQHELEFHFSETIAHLRSAGMTEADARAEAQRRFGDVDHYRRTILAFDAARLRSHRRGARLEALLADVRYALRGMRRGPGFAAVVAVTLGLGIGANATMFGIVDRLLLSAPEHITNPDRVRRIYLERDFLGRTVTGSSLSYLDLKDLEKNDHFAAAGGYSRAGVLFGEGRDAQHLSAALATAGFFPALGVRPYLGRLILPEDETPIGTATVTVLSYELWRREFGGDSTVLGRVLTIGKNRYTVVGVMPPGFTGVDLSAVDLWLPLRPASFETVSGPWETSRGFQWIRLVARLRPGVTTTQAEASATAIARAAVADTRREAQEPRVIVAPLLQSRGPLATAETEITRWLVGVSAVVLLIAIANVANLLLARGTRRRREIAVRLALGISRRRLVAQLVAEGALYGLLGLGAALVLAQWGGHLLRNTLLPGVSWTSGPINLRVFGVAAVAALLAGLAASLIPAVQATHPDLSEALKVGSTGAGTRRTRTQTVLLVAQASLSVVLLVGAGLFVRSLMAVSNMDLGIDTRRVLAITFQEAPLGATEEATYQAFARLGERLAAMPTIAHVALASTIPFRTSWSEDLSVPGLDSLPRTNDGGPYINAVGEDFFATMGTQILRGRGFTAADTKGAPRVAVVNETMADLIWPGEDAIGKCLKIGGDTVPCADVVGIAENTRRQTLIEDRSMLYYVPVRQEILAELPTVLFVRPAGDVRAAQAQLRRDLDAIPDLPVYSLRRMSDLYDGQLRSWRLGASMFALFGGLALVVAAIGLYSLMSYSVSQRTQELGIRSALGATRPGLVRMVLWEGFRLVVVGIALGWLVALAAGRAVEPLLYAVKPSNPTVYVVVGATLGIAALVASTFPAIRAARVDPARALRAE